MGVSGSGLLKRLGKMLTEDLDVAEDVRVERECCEPGTQRARDCHRGDQATMVGKLRSCLFYTSPSPPDRT